MQNKQEGGDKFVLRLFVSGASPLSAKAVSNIKAVCEEHLAGRYELEIIDVRQQPLLAKTEDLVVLPMLLKKEPSPVRRLVGDLSNTARVLSCLGINTSYDGSETGN